MTSKLMRIVFFAGLCLCVPAGSFRAQTTHKPVTRAARRPSTAARRSLLRPASLNQKAPDGYRARFTTTKGDFAMGRLENSIKPSLEIAHYRSLESGITSSGRLERRQAVSE